jgi:glycosyltransferase involved in cell wall biosynthesis
MRIAQVITRLIIGGAQENTLLTCEGLAERGHDVILLSGPTRGPEGSLVERARAGPYRYEEIPALVRAVCPVRDLRTLTALTRCFRRLRPDVVHTHSSKAGILGREAAHRAGVSVVVHTIHGMSFNRTQPLPVRVAYALLERRAARRCHAIVSVADAMTDQALAAGVGRPQQFETIRSGVVIDDFDSQRVDRPAVRRAWGATDDQVVVGTVARLFANKGYEQLIEIISLAARTESALRFVWIGDGADRRRYETALARRGLADRVHMTGLVAPADMPRLLGSIDLLAHASQWEGLPRAVVQAMLMGKPAVTFALDGAPEVVLPGTTGECIMPGDIRAFADAIVSLARNPRRRSAYGEEARRRCRREFDHRIMVDRIEALYRRLASKRHGSAS